MPYFTTSDGTEIHDTDQGEGQPVVLSHGWPLSSDAWQVELELLADNGYRAIAHDRRGHGRSAKMYTGNDTDTYARDLAELIESLDLQNVVLIGHSTGVAKSCAAPPSTAPAEWRRSSPRELFRQSWSSRTATPFRQLAAESGALGS